MFHFDCRQLACLAAAILVAGPAVAQHAPRTAITWIQEQLDAPEDGLLIVPSPDIVETRPAGDSANAESDRLEAVANIAQDLEDAVISVGDLPTISEESLSSEIWRDIPRGRIEELMGSVGPTGIHAANRLLRSILLTPVPASEDSLVHARSRALIALGAVPEAVTVARTANQTTNTTLEIQVLGELLLGNGANSCEYAGSLSDAIPTGLAGVFCAAVLGDRNRAESLLEIAISVGEASDYEVALLDAVITPELQADLVVPENPNTITDYIAGLLGYLDRSMPEDWVEKAPLRRVWIAAAPESGSKRRIRALERLEPQGLTSAEHLSNAYSESNGESAEERFLWSELLAATQVTVNNEQLADLVAAGLRLGRLRDNEGTAARLLAPVALNLTPGPGTGELARSMQRLFLLANIPDSALIWVPSPAKPIEAMLLAIAMSEPPQIWEPSIAEELASRYNAEGNARDGRLLAALAAFGRIDPGSRLEGETPAALTSALAGTQDAEAAFLSLAGVRDRNVSPGVLFTILSALYASGFETSARQIAVEVVLLGE